MTGPTSPEEGALSAMGEALALANAGRRTAGPRADGPQNRDVSGHRDYGDHRDARATRAAHEPQGPHESRDAHGTPGAPAGGRPRPEGEPTRAPATPPSAAPAPDQGRRTPGGDHTSASSAPAARHAMPWPEARRVASAAGRRLPPVSRPLAEALGQALAVSLTALTDLPPFDTSAMDGWAVAGPGPWRLRGQLLAGQRPGEPLADGHAVRIATGAVLPPGATAVIRREHGRTEGGAGAELLHPAHGVPQPGQDVRPRGQECRGGEELLPPGTLVTPAVLGLAAAAGYDELTVTARPRVEVLVLGDELLDSGLPHGGHVRDALGPMLPSWLRALGAEVTATRRLVDDADVLRQAVQASTADLLITTGGTAGGPVDHVHPVLRRIGAGLLVDGVAVRPGHPMLLAELPRGGHLIGLPGNPLAAVSGVLTLAAPLLRTLSGRLVPAPYTAPLTADVSGHPTDTRLVPVVFDDESAVVPLHFHGPAMLRGLAAADGMAVIPPGGAPGGREVAVLDTAWWGAG